MLAAIQRQYAIGVQANQNESNKDVRRKLLFLWFDVEHKTFPILVSQNKLNYIRCQATPRFWPRLLLLLRMCPWKVNESQNSFTRNPFRLVEKSNQLQKIQLTFRLLNRMMSEPNTCNINTPILCIMYINIWNVKSLNENEIIWQRFKRQWRRN